MHQKCCMPQKKFIPTANMVQLTTQQRTFVVKTYHETRSFIAVQNAFRDHFPERQVPTKMTIWKNVRKYEEHGTSLNRNKGHSGHRRTGRSEEHINVVREAIEGNPTLSTRRNDTGLPRATFNRITRLDLHLHPYHIHVQHQLLPADLARRLAFSQWFVDKCHRDPQFLQFLSIGDEAAFSMNGKVNFHNEHMYAELHHPPGFSYDVNMSRQKVNVWIGLCGNGSLLGPFFFEGNLNGQAYLNMINDFVVPEMDQIFPRQRRGAFRRVWWAQDGAPAHRLIAVRNRLAELFGNRVIALFHQVEWPARSPDLTPCDFFLWGHLKGKVFTTPPANIQELRARLVDEVNHLRQDHGMIRRAVRDMTRRCQLCIVRNGGHVEGTAP